MIDRLGGIEEGGPRRYPQTWLLLDVVDRRPRLLGQEIVDLSPGAIELRQVARELGAASEDRERWVPLGPRSPVDGLGPAHSRRLSFGIDVSLCVELDGRRVIHDGRPFRHLRLRRASGALTPATSAEVGLYFYGRRPATFGFVRADTAHGFVGFEWEGLDEDDVTWLLERELEDG